MSIATLDETLLPILEAATDRVVVRAKDGRVLGYFQPAVVDEQSSQSPFTDEQLRELQRNKGQCMPLAEFWKRLGVQ